MKTKSRFGDIFISCLMNGYITTVIKQLQQLGHVLVKLFQRIQMQYIQDGILPTQLWKCLQNVNHCQNVSPDTQCLAWCHIKASHDKEGSSLQKCIACYRLVFNFRMSL